MIQKCTENLSGVNFTLEKNIFVLFLKYIHFLFLCFFLAGRRFDSFSLCPLAVALSVRPCLPALHFGPLRAFNAFCGLLCLFNACGLIWGILRVVRVLCVNLNNNMSFCQCSFCLVWLYFCPLRAFAPCGVFPALVVLAVCFAAVFSVSGLRLAFVRPCCLACLFGAFKLSILLA